MFEFLKLIEDIIMCTHKVPKKTYKNELLKI